MAPTKKSTSPGKARSSGSGPKISLARVKGENFYRTGKQVARLKVLNSGKAVRDKDGNIIQAAAFQKGEKETKPGRVQPDRRWFGKCWKVVNLWIVEELNLLRRKHKSDLANRVGSLPNESLREEG